MCRKNRKKVSSPHLTAGGLRVMIEIPIDAMDGDLSGTSSRLMLCSLRGRVGWELDSAAANNITATKK